MFVYFLRRLLYTVPIAIGVSLFCFALIHLAPGDPLSAVLPESASPQLVAEVRAAHDGKNPPPAEAWDRDNRTRLALGRLDTLD
ncbi:MAG: hypothetical protein ACT6RI_16835, partial [Aeromicrobium sp.]